MKKYFENMKIGRKLMCLFFGIIVLYIITISAAIYNIRSLSYRIEELYNEPFYNVETSFKLSMDVQAVGRDMLLLASGGNEDTYDQVLDTIKERIDNEKELLEDLTSGRDVGGTSALEQQFTQLSEPRTKVLRYLEAGDKKAAYKVYLNEYEPVAVIVRQSLSETVDTCIKVASTSIEDSERMSNNIILMMAGLSVFCILMTIAMWLYITRSIVNPIQKIRKVTKDVAEGKLSIDLTYVSENELGELADNMRDTVHTLHSYLEETKEVLVAIGKGQLTYQTKLDYKGEFISLQEGVNEITTLLRSALQQINSSAEQVSSGAEQVSNGAQLLAHGASEQASSIEELALSINEIADIVEKNADIAVTSSEIAKDVGHQMISSNDEMDRLLESMQLLKQNSKEINTIVKEIEEIAFQTNILALNASVEAARAGDAGKGFSVVANEVRMLANKTSNASRLTSDLIEKNNEAVEEGLTAVNKTAVKLQDSARGAVDVTEKVDHISTLSLQQKDAISQIRKSVELISDIVQGNSATSEESAAASEELSAQAQILKQLVERFDI